MNSGTKQRSKGHRALDVQLLIKDIPTLTKQIRKEITWKKSDRNAITLFKTDGLSIVLIAMHTGAKMIKHTVNGIISIYVLEGEMQFDTDGSSEDLKEGQILVLQENIPHSVLATKRTVFLLTLTTSAEERK